MMRSAGCRVKSDGARDTARASKEGSMPASSISPDIHSGTTTERAYTIHKEHSEQDGKQYLCCQDCNREDITDHFDGLRYEPSHRRWEQP